MIGRTIGQREIHSADEKDHILHAGEQLWLIVWRGKRRPHPFRTREYARVCIRFLKSLRPGTQLSLGFTKDPSMPIDPKKLPEMNEWEFKHITKGRKQQGADDYQHRTGCTAEEAMAVANYWLELAFPKQPGAAS